MRAAVAQYVGARGMANALVVALVLLGLYGTRLHSYLLFHSLVEMFSIVVACAIFTVFWNSRQFLDNGCFLFMGVAYLFVGVIDLIHTLAYKDMPVLQGYPARRRTTWRLCRSSSMR
ncbi:MAG: MASE3 domain-containing protein [Planctomycetota bacterium]